MKNNKEKLFAQKCINLLVEHSKFYLESVNEQGYNEIILEFTLKEEINSHYLLTERWFGDETIYFHVVGPENNYYVNNLFSLAHEIGHAIYKVTKERVESLVSEEAIAWKYSLNILKYIQQFLNKKEQNQLIDLVDKYFLSISQNCLNSYYEKYGYNNI